MSAAGKADVLPGDRMTRGATVPGNLIAMVALVAWNLAALLLTIQHRFAPVEWSAAWPGPGRGLLVEPWPWLLAALALGSLAVFAIRQSWRLRRAVLVLLIWPALPLTLAWDGLPVAMLTRSTIILVGGVTAVLGVLVWSFGQRLGQPRCGNPWPMASLLSGRVWVVIHGIGLPLFAALGIGLGGTVEPARLLTSLVTYPFYALIQLALVLAVPWPWVRVVAGSHRVAIIVLVAGTFALIHWPQPALVLATALGAVIWTYEYARGRPLWQLALSMGLWATLLAQTYPEEVINGMRVGPEATRARAVESLAAQALASVGGVVASEPELGDVLDYLYAEVIPRSLDQTEREKWLATLRHEQRCVLAWLFLAGEEARRREVPGALEAPDGRYYWTELPTADSARIRAHVAANQSVTDWHAYLRTCYREFLGRTAGEGELSSWRQWLSDRQVHILAREIVESHGVLRGAAFDTLASDQWRFWR